MLKMLFVCDIMSPCNEPQIYLPFARAVNLYIRLYIRRYLGDIYMKKSDFYIG